MEQFAVVSGANHWKKVIAGKFPVNLLFFFWREVGWDKSVC